LPIPEPSSPVRYRDLVVADIGLGELVEQLTDGRYRRDHAAHLDPDLHRVMLSRPPQWRPLLGQSGSAQGHLANQRVGVGDIFLFFGLFQPARRTGGKWCFDKLAPRRHVLWGWLQVGEVYRIDALGPNDLVWARYHPHFAYTPDASNTLYVAADQLVLGGVPTGVAGAGVFTAYEEQLCLTARSGATSLSTWRLPRWFYPDAGRRPLSFHHNRERWRQKEDCTLLQAASRGQEFVLQLEDYPEAEGWLRELLGGWRSSSQAESARF
jgi:hypothetical protein